MVVVLIKEDSSMDVLRMIYESDGISRLGLSNLTGLTQAGITKIVKKLLDTGIVTESPTATSVRGRPQVALHFNRSCFVTMGIRLNRNYIRMNACDLGGRQLMQCEMPITATVGVNAALSEMKTMIRTNIKKFQDKRVIGIGAAVPGPFLVKQQKIMLMSGFEGWNQITLKNDLEAACGIPVFVEHDALCGALNEYYYEENGKPDTIVFVAADKGVGAGILIRGKPFHGAIGTAGEFGHASIDFDGEKCICGNRGCLEMYCSTDKLVENYGDRNKTADDILLEVINNVPRAKHVYEEAARFLGIGIVNLIYHLNPKTIVVSDTFAKPEKLLFRIIDSVMKERLLPDIYRQTKLVVRPPESDYILLGANALVLNRLFTNPSSLNLIRRNKNDTENRKE